MSKIIERLRASSDPLERDLASVLVAWQDEKRAVGRRAVLGYEPRDINRYGAIEVITRRVCGRAVGFDEVPLGQSYEALVLKYPDRFRGDVVRVATDRLSKARS